MFIYLSHISILSCTYYICVFLIEDCSNSIVVFYVICSLL